MVSSQYYNLTSSTSKFVSSRIIKSKRLVTVRKFNTATGTWVIVEQDQFDLLNNTVITNSSIDSGTYSKVELRVGDNEAELETEPTDIESVASIADKVSLVAGAIAQIVELSQYTAKINLINSNVIADIETLSNAGIISDINTIASNIAEIVELSGLLGSAGAQVDDMLQWNGTTWVQTKDLVGLNSIITNTINGIDLTIIPSANIDFENKIGTITHINSLDKVYNHMYSSGIVNGCDITDNLDGTINISAGECTIRATGDDGHGTLYSAEIPAVTNLALTDNAINYVTVNYNDGVTLVSESLLSPATINMIDVIPAYVIVREGTRLTWRDARSQNVNHIAKNQIKEFYTETLKRKNGGSVISDAGTLHLACTAGAFFFQLNEIAVPALNTTGTDTFEYYKHVSGVWTETDAQVFDALNYDNGTDLVAVGNNNYGVHWVYAMVGSTSHYAVLYGNASYSNIASAQAATTPTSLPPSVEGLGYLLGRVITQSGDPEIVAVATTFNTTFQSTLATDHENLAGLLGGSVGDHMHLTTTEYNNLIALGTLAEFEASLVTGV